MSQCQHVKNGHCGKCAFPMYRRGVGSIEKKYPTRTTEHANNKSRGLSYLKIESDLANSIINSGIRLNSSRIRIFPN